MKSQFKKSISLICALILIVSVLSLSACGNDSDSIVGTWKAAPGYTLQPFGDIISITFYADGTFKHNGGRYDGYSSKYSIIHDGTAISFYGASIVEYEFLSNNRIVLKTDPECVLERID